ncbi:MAG: hypothetical protein SFX73_13770 [Kofleriaceae bacterium]|nr:hypothetical protein [Kofleriaceae bacterium]
MIRRHVLAALAAGIAEGDDDAARKALRRTDWAIRSAARRRLERSLIDAALATNELGGAADPEAARHVQRVAALAVAGAAIDDVSDRARVEAAYRALPAVVAPKLPLFTILAATLVTALVAGGLYWYETRPGPPPRTHQRPLSPPVAGAFKDGGVPLGDPALETLFVDRLTELVLESDRDRQGGGIDKDRKAHSIALIGAPEVQKHGPALVKAWADMLDMLDRWVSVPVSSREFRDIARQFRYRVRAVSDQLAAAGIGLFLEGDVMVRGSGAAHALIYAYKVEEVVILDAGGQPRRVLSLRRLDRLNMSHTLLGMQSSELGDPVLLLDQIDEHVASHVLPVLAPNAAYSLGDDDWMRGDGKELAAIAGEAIRQELAAAFGGDAEAAHKIAALLQERGEIIEEWREIMERRGYRLARTDDLFLPETMTEDLEGAVPRFQRDRVDAIEAELAQLEAPRIASRCHELVAATIRRHEAQHGMDDDRSTPLAYPTVLEELLGDALDEDGEPDRTVESGRAELSAYTSQLANDTLTPQMSLWNVARFAFNNRHWGSSESYAAVIIVEGLARHLKLPSDGPVIHGRRIDRARLAALIKPMATMPGEQLRAAARAVWRDLYSEDIVPIIDRTK